MADVSPGELQTLVATLQGVTLQLGNIAKAVTRAGAPSGAILDAVPPAGPIAGYVSLVVNDQTIKLPYYTS